MNNGPVILKGRVHGRTIELDGEPGLPEGLPVTISLEPASEPRSAPPGEGIRQSAGAWSDDPAGLDEFLEWNRQQRKARRPEIDA
jgi:hypothetical protein